MFRYSLLGTLAAKHKCSLKQIISKYSLNPKVEYTFINNKEKEESEVLASFPSKEFFNNKKKQFNIESLSFIYLPDILRRQRISRNASSIGMLVNYICGVKICKNFAQESYQIRNLKRRYMGSYINILSFYRIKG